MKESAFGSAVRLIEEAIVLLRRVHSTAWLVYFAGVAPFFGLLLYEITDLAQNPLAFERLGGVAFALALLYCWLHVCQAVFCACLEACVTETEIGLRSRFVGAMAVQPIVAAAKLIIWPVTLLLVVPHAAVTMFFQHSLVSSGTGTKSLRSVIAESRHEALYRQWQAIWMLLLVLLLRGIVWTNVFALLFLGPAIWKTVTGMEGKLTRSPDLLVNPTSLVAVSTLAYISLDPIVKAACVLRHFARGSDTSGLDLRLRLSVLRKAAIATALVLFAVCVPTRGRAATEATVRSGPASPTQMREAIKTVFRDPHDIWQLPVVQPRRAAAGPFTAFVDWLGAQMSGAWKSIRAALSSLAEALRQILERLNEAKEAEAHPVSRLSGWMVIAIFSLFVAGVVVAGLWKRGRRRRPQVTVITGIAAKPVDLAGEEVEAMDQPEDEWTRLAREHRASGNLRLALRALYLATLAAFGQSGLITLGRGKSNLDYLRELQRRGKRLKTDPVPVFRSNLGLFEETWYGNHPVSIQTLEQFERNASALRQLL